MNATLPSISADLLAPWSSSWRHQLTKRRHAPTPPLTLPHRPIYHHHAQSVTLPPLSQLDRQLARPLTPPHARGESSSSWHKSEASPSRLPPIDKSYHPRDTSHSSNVSEYVQVRPPSPTIDAQIAQWFSLSSTRSAHYIAEKMCEMVCYLWFSNGTPASSSRRSGRDRSPSSSSYDTPANASLQLTAAPGFVTFMRKLLETTQVSQSVIVLSLHYIYRLKERNALTRGQSGSEFRVAVAALMMANKFVDDNTYTNKTWSEVSGIELEEINKMEREFLRGIDFGLYVDKTTYESWLNLLKGLVLAKEREAKHWHQQRVRRHPRAHVLPRPVPSAHDSASYYGYRAPSFRTATPRARSSSPPRPCSYDGRPQLAPPAPARTELPPIGSKRSATDAFSPTTSEFTLPPLKRPTGVTLEIPSCRPAHGSAVSPTEHLSSFAELSLASRRGSSPSAAVAPAVSQDMAPRTLAAPYRVDPSRTHLAPQNLYYYSLACSPSDGTQDVEVTEDHAQPYARKARLRSYQPSQLAPPALQAPTHYAHAPQVVHSASTSPMHVSVNFAPCATGTGSVVTLPSFSETAWGPPGRNLDSPAVPSTPFANAGPPGFMFSSDTPARGYAAHHDSRHWASSGRRW